MIILLIFAWHTGGGVQIFFKNYLNHYLVAKQVTNLNMIGQGDLM